LPPGGVLTGPIAAHDSRAADTAWLTLRIVFGIVPIVAGLDKVIVGLWLLGIALDLVIAGYHDIAVRDAVMAVCSFCLARLTAPATQAHRAMQPAQAT